jgi:hypothetical protein
MRFQVFTVTSMKMAVSGMLRCVVWYTPADVSEMLPAIIIRAHDGGSKLL